MTEGLNAAHLVILLVWLTPGITSQNAQTDQGAGAASVSESHGVKVSLFCEPKVMRIQLMFVNSSGFYDWILVGNGHSEKCRMRGNGDRSYTLQVPIMVDECGTKMIEPGTFENTISIKTNPMLILQGDEHVNVRCSYGPPEVLTLAFPALPSSPQPAVILTTTTASPGSILPPEVNRAELSTSYVYLIVFLILLLAFACLLCCCLFFCVRRRNIAGRNSEHRKRRKRLLISIPSSSEISKHGLWWPKARLCHDDGLLNHDFMVSGSSGREHLSISTEYPVETTTPSSTSSSGNSPSNVATMCSKRSQISSRGSSCFQNQAFVHESRNMNMIPRIHVMAPEPERNFMLVNSLHSIPEEDSLSNINNNNNSNNNDKHTADAAEPGTSKEEGIGRGSNFQQYTCALETTAHIDAPKHKMIMSTADFSTPHQATYAIVSPSRGKFWQREEPSQQHQLGDEEVHDRTLGPLATSRDHFALSRDGKSINIATNQNEPNPVYSGKATLEDRMQYCAHFEDATPTTSSKTTTVQAQIHELSARDLENRSMRPSILEKGKQNNNKSLTSTAAAVTSNKCQFTATMTTLDRDKLDFVRAVESQRGFGRRKLTENDIRRWKTMLNNDSVLLEQLRRARTVDDFETISNLPQYQNSFTRERWSVMTQSLAHVVFTKRLNSIIDGHAAARDPPMVKEGKRGASRENLKRLLGAKVIQSHHNYRNNAEPDPEPERKQRRYIKKAEQIQTIPAMFSEPVQAPPAPECLSPRLFTRDSYYRVRDELDSSFSSPTFSDDDDDVCSSVGMDLSIPPFPTKDCIIASHSKRILRNDCIKDCLADQDRYPDTYPDPELDTENSSVTSEATLDNPTLLRPTTTTVHRSTFSRAVADATNDTISDNNIAGEGCCSTSDAFGGGLQKSASSSSICTETVITAPSTLCRDRSSSECFEVPPMLR